MLGALDALDRGHGDAPIEKRIFAEALKHASALRHARNVDVGRFKEQAAQRARLFGFQLAVGRAPVPDPTWPQAQ